MTFSWTIAACCAGCCLVTYIVTRASTKRKIIDKINFMSDALCSGESAFRYSTTGIANRRLNNALNRLRSIFEAENSDFIEREKYFGTMLDHVQSGVIVLDGDKVLYCNIIAREMLGMSEISTLKQIDRLSPELASVFFNADEVESHAKFESERGEIQFSISCCPAVIKSRQVKIITFNDVTREMENNENESWSRLIRVLTHEIMNTVTPIASLSSALSQNIDNYSSEDISSALGTISSSSEGLISFVQSYRSLTHLSAPVRKAFYFKDIAADTINIAHTNWPGITVTYKEHPEDIILYADPGQISQVINNLVKNAAQAGASKIDISAEIDKREQTVINVCNNGEPISKASQEQIFVPFYTTKGASGTGVGLSLSRQMVRLNGGTIKLTSSTEAGGTVFTLIF